MSVKNVSDSQSDFYVEQTPGSEQQAILAYPLSELIANLLEFYSEEQAEAIKPALKLAIEGHSGHLYRGVEKNISTLERPIKIALNLARTGALQPALQCAALLQGISFENEEFPLWKEVRVILNSCAQAADTPLSPESLLLKAASLLVDTDYFFENSESGLYIKDGSVKRKMPPQDHVKPLAEITAALADKCQVAKNLSLNKV